MATTEQTLAQRQHVHGDFTDNADVTERLMAVLHSTANWENLPPVQRVALFHIQHKIARIMSGDHNFIDHWHDIQGYAKCVEDRLPQPEPIEVPDFPF